MGSANDTYQTCEGRTLVSAPEAQSGMSVKACQYSTATISSQKPRSLWFTLRALSSIWKHFAHVAATKQPDGQISENLSSPERKNIPLNPSGKSALPTRPFHPMRGALRNVTNARWDAVDAALAKTNAR